MLPDGSVKLSTFTAPAGAGYFTGSSVVALADGVGAAEEDAEDVGYEPPVGPSYPRVNTKMTMPRRIAAMTPRLTSTIAMIGKRRRSSVPCWRRDPCGAAGWR